MHHMASPPDAAQKQVAQSRATGLGLRTWANRLLTGLNVVLLTGAVGVSGALFIPFMRNALVAAPPPLPAAMEEVDWHDPESSTFCLACHKEVAPAMAGLDVERGHPQNVVLNEQQLAALVEMGTVAGPGHTLICMSCHKLGQTAHTRYMLADTLIDSALCQRCHPGHYAQGTPHDLRISAPDENNRIGQTVSEGGPCSACHLSHRYARDFVRSPLDPDGRCITCHQQYRIAAGHARTTMDHPDAHCGECHNPHDMRHDEFLGADVNQVCVRCHVGYDGGLLAGMHPVGPMEQVIPAVLLQAGADALGDPHQLTCVTCHDVHEANHGALLHFEPDSNRLCLTCHEDKLLDKSHAGILPKHGQMPVLNEHQAQVVADWGNPAGPQGELLCVSCHRIHASEKRTPLLSFRPQYGETCVACHPQQATVFGTSHDLRTNFPELANSDGMTPAAAGACSACHLAHQFPRQPVPTEADPGGQCISCHRVGDCASSATVQGAQHPQTACIECHDPHERRHENYLRANTAQLCADCHPSQMRVTGGPHDLNEAPAAWPEVAREGGDVCLSCHVPHGGEREDLFRVATGQAVGNHDEVCLACHAAAGWGAPSSIAAIHAQKIAPEHSHVNLALVPTDAAGNYRMGCRTCHDPHGGAEPVHLARVAPGTPTESLCLACHVEKQLIVYTDHSPEKLASAGYETDSCKPCHAMHAEPDDLWGQSLSPRFLMDYCEPEHELGGGCVPCLACHHPNSPAPMREVASHPEVLMMNIIDPQSPSYMPLFNIAGKVDQQGQISCRTCHVSHGRLDLLRQLQELGTVSDEDQHAINAQVRAYIAPNLCSSCHGADGRRLFLYFHDPERRADPTLGP